MTDDIATQLPRYACHKVVSAGKIASFSSPHDYSENRKPIVRVSMPGTDTLIEVTCELAMFSRGDPKIGDYLVVYEDGYKSFSPAKAFEDGYTLIELPEA